MGYSTAGPTGATQDAAKKVRQEEKQTCLPVTIRTVERAIAQTADFGGELRFFGAEIGQGMLILVGIIDSMKQHSANVEFSLNDSTGRIKARYYKTASQSNELDELAPGMYVSVFGAVRTAPETHFAVAGMRLVKSADEVSYHMVEVAYAALKLKGSHEPTTPAPKKNASSALAEPSSASTGLSPVKVDKVTSSVSEAAAIALPTSPLSGKALRTAVLAFLQKEGDGRPEGVAFAAICNHANPTPTDEVRAALERLVTDGDVFTTIDEGHFQCI